MERDFMQIVEEARAKLRAGPLGFVPPGIVMRHPETGEPICNLSDPDILLKFRAACMKRQRNQHYP
jgi:hypothetical protein